jgi:hypothetical protein
MAQFQSKIQQEEEEKQQIQKKIYWTRSKGKAKRVNLISIKCNSVGIMSSRNKKLLELIKSANNFILGKKNVHFSQKVEMKEYELIPAWKIGNRPGWTLDWSNEESVSVPLMEEEVQLNYSKDVRRGRELPSPNYHLPLEGNFILKINFFFHFNISFHFFFIFQHLLIFFQFSLSFLYYFF